MTMPHVLESGHVAKLLGWDTQKARRWLQSTGAGVKRGGRWITTPERLRERFAEVFDVLVLAGVEVEADLEPTEGCVSCRRLMARAGELEAQIDELALRLARQREG